MHVLLIPSGYPSNENPIRGVFFREQALALQKRGHAVGVMVLPKMRSKRELTQIRRILDLKQKITYKNDQGVITCRSEQWRWVPGFFRKANIWLRNYAGKRVFHHYLLVRGMPDIIHAHSVFYGGYLASHIGKHWNVPVVLTEHSTSFLRNTLSPDQAKIARYTLTSTQRNIAVGHCLAEVMQTYDPQRKVAIIGNLVNTDYFLPSHLQPGPYPFVFSSIGILRPKKGMDILLTAFAEAFRDEQVILEIGGDGSEKTNLQLQAQNLGITSQVNFLGSLSRDQTRELIQRSHSVVSASRFETFGITLIEAMACGKPVVATQSGGPEFFVNPQNGILCPPSDTSALAAALQQMIQNYDQFDPDKIRSYCVTNFSEQAIVQNLEDIYQEILTI